MVVTVKKPVTIRRISDLRANHMILGFFCLDLTVGEKSFLTNGCPLAGRVWIYVDQQFKCVECGGHADKQV